jgi:radical SAM superfamily enzyme YgiQ (UPF0313 family)
MKKILLINSNMETVPYPVPPLGLCLLQSVLEHDYVVKIYDAVFTKGNGLEKVLDEFRPDYVGISIRNIDNLNMNSPVFYIDDINEKIVKTVKRCTDVPLILGGSGFSVFPDEIMEVYGADYGVVGEGELALPHLLECLETNSGITHPAVITRGKSPTGVTSKGCFDLSEMKFSGIDLKIDYSPYKSRGAYPIQTKRGCAHRCIYCSYPLIEGKSFRKRNPSDIADEIEEACGRLGFTTFEFVDSTFNDPHEHAEQICREIIRRKLKINIRTMGINPDNATKELFELMLEAGFSQIDCTPDTASETMLRNMGKNFNLKKLEDTARIIREIDIPTMWFFIFGGPGENAATCDETLEFVDRHINKLDMVHSTFGLRIYPGTKLCDISVEKGVTEKDAGLLKPKFFFSEQISYEEVCGKLAGFSVTHPNLVPINEVRPSEDMFKRAISMREEMNLREPMFRTLLRVRYENFGMDL